MRGTPKVMRLVAAVALALAAVVLLLGVSGPAQAQSRQETLIIARNIDDYVTNDVHRTYEYTSQILDTAAYDTLVTVDAPDFTKIQPRLATSWTVSPDGTTYTFKLRPGVKFTSGNPLTANDVRFSLRRLKNLKDNPSFFMDPVKDVQVVDDLTVRIVLAAPDASFLAALAAVPCGVADSKVVMAKGGTDADDAQGQGQGHRVAEQPVGRLGPVQAGLVHEERRGGPRAERDLLGQEALLREGDLQARARTGPRSARWSSAATPTSPTTSTSTSWPRSPRAPRSRSSRGSR